MDGKTIEIEVKNLDHLGIVAGIIDEIGLVEQVNELLGTQKQEVITPGQVLKAMILNGLGFVSAPLYLFSQFFEGKAIEHLLGEGIEAKQLNDDRLGRALDDYYRYGVTKLFTTVALSAAKKFGVETQRVHLDSSSLAVEGEYLADTQTSKSEGTTDELVPIQITYGYSRDRRPDLKQFMIDTICSGDGDVPLYLRVADGNEADAVGFGKVLAQYRQQWQFDGMLVADAALYTAENLQQLAGLKWISRVPLTLELAKEVIRQVTPMGDWEELPLGYRWIELCTTYAQIEQRWVVVESDNRRAADLQQLDKRLQKEQQRHNRQLNQLCKESFACEADALKAMNQFEQTLHYHGVSQVAVMMRANHAGRGRPKANSVPQSLSYHLQAVLVENSTAIEEQQRIAGRFILATNELECQSLSGADCLTHL
jgi:transposase